MASESSSPSIDVAKSSSSKKELPISLTASDGTGLRLVALKTRAILDEPLAYTEAHMSFENLQSRMLEGHFEITLPVGVTVSRFAMKIGDTWQEAEMVEKVRAREVYESFLHRRQDPALLEQAAGNSFSARVFPIPANGTKEIVIAYAQELPSGTDYAFPLAGLPAVDDLDVAIWRAGEERPIKEWKRRGGPAPDENAVVAARDDEKSTRPWDGMRSGNLVLTRVRPEIRAGADSFAGGALMLVDTSASRALGFAEQIRLVQRLAQEIAASGGPSTHLMVAAFDQDVAPMYDGPAAGFDAAAASKLLARDALGASNLEGALAWAARNVRSVRRAILVGDGVSTAGADSRTALAEAARRLGAAGVQRIDAVAVGGIRDEEAFAHLTSGVLPHEGVVVNGRDPREVVSRLTRAAMSGLAVGIEGASWVWPERLDGVQPGDERFVYAEIPAGSPVRVRIGDGPSTMPTYRTVDKPLLEHAWARAKIASMLAAVKGEPDERVRKRVIALSRHHRVLSPYTSLLVLETEEDYRRFGMDRSAPRDYLFIRGSRVVTETRSGPLPPKGWVRAANTANANPGADAPALQAPQDPPASVASPAPAPPAAPAATAAPAPAAEPASRTAHEEVVIVAHAPTVDVGSTSSGANLSSDFTSRIPITNPGARGGAARAFESTADEAPPGWPFTAQQASHMFDSLGPTVWRSVSPTPPSRRQPAPPPAPPSPFVLPAVAEPAPPPTPINPYAGTFDEVMRALGAGEPKRALDKAARWHRDAPGDVMALVAFGEALEATGDFSRAARSYGSIVDLFPARADLRRFAGERLERVRASGALELAMDTYGKAVKQRPDHPSSHRLLAFARLRKGDYAGAFEALEAGLRREYPTGRFNQVQRVLREDLGLIAAAWLRVEPRRKDEVLKRLRDANASLESDVSLRFVLNWETDANDVDFHIEDAAGGHAFYGHPKLESGGELYGDVVTGYGPECFTIRAPKSDRFGPYKLRAHYYSRGPMGYGMGKVEIIEHDGKGKLTFQERPFVVMTDGAFVELGTVE